MNIIACTNINTLEHDSFYWDAPSNGVFTCKFAYWIATQTIEGFQASLLTHERESSSAAGWKIFLVKSRFLRGKYV